MRYQFEARAVSGHPYLQIRDVASDTVRLMWQHPVPTGRQTEDPLARALAAEEALHKLFKRLFLLAAEQRINQPATPTSRPYHRPPVVDGSR